MHMEELLDNEYVYFIQQSVLRQANDRAWVKGTTSSEELATLLDLVPSLLPGRQNTSGHWMRKAHSEESGEIFGYIWVGRYPGIPDNTGVLLDIVVDQAWRGKGIGREMVNRMLEWYRLNGTSAIILNVRSDNTAAICLYNSVGFILTRPCSGAGFLEMSLAIASLDKS